MIDNDEVIQKLVNRACSDVRAILKEEDDWWRRIAIMHRHEWNGRWYMAHDLKQRDLLEIIDRGMRLMDAAEAYRGRLPCPA